MSEPFKGRIGTTTESQARWPARPAAPNVLIIALDDTGFSSCRGRPGVILDRSAKGAQAHLEFATGMIGRVKGAAHA